MHSPGPRGGAARLFSGMADAQVVGCQHLGPPEHETIDALEVKSRFHQLVDAPVEIAASGHPPLDGVESILPAGDVGMLGSTMLHEMQGSPGFEHAAHFVQGALHVGDCAQGPRARDAVHAFVPEGNVGPVQTDEGHGHGSLAHPMLGELAGQLRGFQRQDLRDFRRVELQVVTCTESNLQNTPGKAIEAASAMVAEESTAHAPCQ